MWLLAMAIGTGALAMASRDAHDKLVVKPRDLTAAGHQRELGRALGMGDPLPAPAQLPLFPTEPWGIELMVWPDGGRVVRIVTDEMESAMKRAIGLSLFSELGHSQLVYVHPRDNNLEAIAAVVFEEDEAWLSDKWSNGEWIGDKTSRLAADRLLMVIEEWYVWENIHFGVKSLHPSAQEALLGTDHVWTEDGFPEALSHARELFDANDWDGYTAFVDSFPRDSTLREYLAQWRDFAADMHGWRSIVQEGDEDERDILYSHDIIEILERVWAEADEFELMLPYNYTVNHNPRLEGLEADVFKMTIDFEIEVEDVVTVKRDTDQGDTPGWAVDDSWDWEAAGTGDALNRAGKLRTMEHAFANAGEPIYVWPGDFTDTPAELYVLMNELEVPNPIMTDLTELSSFALLAERVPPDLVPFFYSLADDDGEWIDAIAVLYPQEASSPRDPP